MSFKKGQILLYLTTKGGHPHIEVVMFKGEGSHPDRCDVTFVGPIGDYTSHVLPSNLYTKEQILEMFFNIEVRTETPGVDFYKASMEKHYGLRICPECGHENRHPNNHCDKCTKYLEPRFKTMKCPRCGEITRRGDRCDHCNKRLPPICYGIAVPRTQDCANCVYTKECLEEQKRPVPVEEITDDPELQESIRRCREEPSSKPWRDVLETLRADRSDDYNDGFIDGALRIEQFWQSTCKTCKDGVHIDESMMETWDCPKCDRVELIIYSRCQSCGYERDNINPDDRMFPSGTLHHEIELPSDKLIEVAKAVESILCPNCKQPVSHKFEHSEGDYDGDSVDQWWECLEFEETKEEDP